MPQPTPENHSHIMRELTNMFGGRKPHPDEEIRMAEFLKPHMKTLAVVALCRLSEMPEVNRNLVEQLVILAKRKDLKMALSLLNDGLSRNQYVMQEMMRKVLKAPKVDGIILAEELEALFDPNDLSALAVAALGFFGNMENPDLERVAFFIDQANWQDLQIALAINSYKNKDVKFMMIQKALKHGLAQVEETYVSKKSYEADKHDLIVENQLLNDKINNLQAEIKTVKTETEGAKQNFSDRFRSLRNAGIHTLCSLAGAYVFIDTIKCTAVPFLVPLFGGTVAASGVICVPIWLYLAVFKDL